MQYRTIKDGTKLSALGFGCMRLPLKDDDLCRKLVETALDNGINYFDTAYLYNGNEELLGRVMPKERRQDYYLAAKIPPMFCKTKGDFEKIFTTELKRLGTDYLDFYLIHCIADVDVWQRLCRMGIQEWIAQKKAEGKIRHIGFSYHGAFPDFKKLVDAYDWDFTQLQFNYLDEHNQAGIDGVNYAKSKGLPLFIMEPLRGGTLTGKLPEAAQALLKEKGVKPADLGLRWVWNHDAVTMVLSGMNAEQQLVENLATVETALPGSLTDEQLQWIEQIKAEFRRYAVVGCTGCGYCMPCPYGVAIPGCFSARNEFEQRKAATKFYKLNPARSNYMHATALLGNAPANASLCRQCGACEKKCPQGIEIRKHLQETAKVLEPWWFMLPMKIYRKINSRK